MLPACAGRHKFSVLNQILTQTGLSVMPLTRKIAFLVANTAFGDIVGGDLRGDARLQVYAFQTIEAVMTFMRIAPVHLVLLDADSLRTDAATAVNALRRQPRLVNDAFSVMMLTRAAPAFHEALLAQGVDVAHSRPVSPARLLDSVLTELNLHPAGPMVDGTYRGPDRRRPRGALRTSLPQIRHGNVIPLFGQRSK